MTVQKSDMRGSRRVAAVGAAAAFALLGAACGGDGDDAADKATSAASAAASVASSAASAASSAAATPAPAGDGKKVVVGLITKTETNPFFIKMKEGAAAAAKEKGVELMTAAGKGDSGDNASQVTAIENMMSAGAKAILITPFDTKAIVPTIKKARDAGVLVIALDTPTDPADAVDALFATDNKKAGVLIGQYAKAAMAGKPAKIALLNEVTGTTVSDLRRDGFLEGFGISKDDPQVVCEADSGGNQGKGQTVMENCLSKDSGINLVYTINEPAAFGANTALAAAGKDKDVIVVSVDGGCAGVTGVKEGKIAATSQQYPLKMASMGVEAGHAFGTAGTKVSGYTDTGVTLISDKPQSGVESKDTAFGLENCWG
jgi:fructose transport system substrate-binding protein